MKRSIKTEVKLPAFAIDLPQLEVLWNRMLQVFGEGAKIRSSIEFVLPKEQLVFDTYAELKNYAGLKGSSTTFFFEMEHGGRSIRLNSRSFFSASPSLVVRGDDDIWCASATAAVEGVISRNRAWYWWILRLPLATFLIAVVGAPMTLGWVTGHPIAIDRRMSFVLMPLVAASGFILLFQEPLFPKAKVQFSDDPGFIRKYSGELGLALSVLGILLALL